MPRKKKREDFFTYDYTPDIEQLKARSNGKRVRVDAEAALNNLAEQCLECLKLCQNQRPVVQKKKAEKKAVCLSESFFDQFTRKLVKLEHALAGIAPAYGSTYVQMITDIARAEDFELVQVVLSDNSILISMPYLPPRNITKVHMYADLLAGKLASLELPKWPCWQAEICQVYSPANIRCARDVDNSDYKHLIDILVIYLGGSDAAGCFGMTIDAQVSNTLPGGTYVKVSPKHPVNPVIASWEQILTKSSENAPPENPVSHQN